MKHQSGNVLFLILIAVALFAALSYVVTQTTRSGTGGTANEKARLQAAALTQYVTSMRAAIIRLQVSNGCGSRISAYWPGMNDVQMNIYDDGDEIPEKCQIYNPRGGGVLYQHPPKEYLDTSDFAAAFEPFYGRYWFSGTYCVPYRGGLSALCGHGEGESDLVFTLPFVSRELCLAINEGLGIPAVNGDAPEETQGPIFPDVAVFPFNGVFPDAGETHPAVSDGLAGYPEGCFKNAAWGLYAYYALVLDR